MHITSYPGIALPIIMRVIALSHALPTFLDPPPSSPPDLAPGTLDDRGATGIIPTVFNVSRPSVQAAPNLATPNPGVPSLEEIVLSGLNLFTPHVQNLDLWRIIAIPSSGMEGDRPANFTRVRLECRFTLPGSGALKLIVADNDPAKPLEWQPPHVIGDLAVLTLWKPFQWTPYKMSLVTAFQLLEQSGFRREMWAKVVQVSYFKDTLEPETHSLSGNQVYYAFAKAMREPPRPRPIGFTWTFVGTMSGKIHRNLVFDRSNAPDTDYGLLPVSTLNGTRMIT